jgi:hypothetical protein
MKVVMLAVLLSKQHLPQSTQRAEVLGWRVWM